MTRNSKIFAGLAGVVLIIQGRKIIRIIKRIDEITDQARVDQEFQNMTEHFE